MRGIPTTAMIIALGLTLGCEPPSRAADAKGRADGLRISEETTFITEPLSEDGLPDYVAALNAMHFDKIPAGKNAAAEYLKLLGGHVPEPIRRKLGIEQWPPEGETWDQASRDLPFAQLSIAINGPWRPADHPELSAWLDRNEKLLDRFVKIFRSPLALPLVSAPDLPLGLQGISEVGQARKVAAAIAVRSQRVDARKLSRRWDDLDAVAGAAEQFCSEPSPVRYLVGLSIRAKAAGRQLLALHWPELTEKELRSLLKRQMKSQPLPSPDLCVQADRLVALDAFTRKPWQAIASTLALGYVVTTEPPAQKQVKRIMRLLRARLPDKQRGPLFATCMREFNNQYDRLVAMRDKTQAGRNQMARSARDRIREIERQWSFGMEFDGLKATVKFLALPSDKQEQAAKTFAQYVVLDLASPLAKLWELSNECRFHDRLTEVAIALAIYRKANGAWPEKLEQLTPGILKELPTERETGQTFIYTRDGESFTIRSPLKDPDFEPLLEYTPQPAGEETTP